MPQACADAGAYSVGYGAQTISYCCSSRTGTRTRPTDPAVGAPPPPHPVHLVGEAHDLRASRVTTSSGCRSHPASGVWYLWGIVVEIVVILNWFVTLIGGKHTRHPRFVASYLRYRFTRAFLTSRRTRSRLHRGTGAIRSTRVPGLSPEPWVTAFRIILAIPALLVVYALLLASSFGGDSHVVCVPRHRMAPWGLRNSLPMHCATVAVQRVPYLVTTGTRTRARSRERHEQVRSTVVAA